MATRWSLLLMAGLSGCAVRQIGYVPAPRTVVHVDSGPRLMVVVGTDLRYCGECEDDVFFYSGSWWAYRSGGWYQSRIWGEPWIIVEAGRLPVQFLEVPPSRFKHRYGPRHPAHEHHPSRDRWSVEESAAPGPPGHREADRHPGRGVGPPSRDQGVSGPARPEHVNRDRTDPGNGRGQHRRTQRGQADDRDTVQVEDEDGIRGKDQVKDKDKAKAMENEKEKEKEKSKDREKKNKAKAKAKAKADKRGNRAR